MVMVEVVIAHLVLVEQCPSSALSFSPDLVMVEIVIARLVLVEQCPSCTRSF